jgi:probable addiction module antidote protein
MTKPKLTPFDVVEVLDTPESQAAYLNVVLEEDDPAAFLAALGTVCRAQGMTRIAKDAGLGRESLYKALGGGASPSLDTTLKVLHALGLKVALQPEEKSAA